MYWPIELAMLCVCRVAAAIAELYFVQGASWNAPATREATEGCYYVKDGVFRRAAILSIVATVLGIKSYFTLRAAATVAVVGPASAAGEPKNGGIAMGQPVYPVYGHYPPPLPGQGYGQFPPPPAQGYGHFPPAAAPAQQHTQAV